MARQKKKDKGRKTSAISFSLGGLIVFSVCLCFGGILLSKLIGFSKPKPYSFATNDIPDPDQQNENLQTRKGPWGELLTQNIKLERPQEYFTKEIDVSKPDTWVFYDMTPDQVKSFLITNGLTKAQVEAQMTPDRVKSDGSKTLFTPNEDFILCLNSKTRSELYGAFYGTGVGAYFDYPFIFPKDNINTIYKNFGLNSDDIAILKRLVYPVSNGVQLSDYNLLLRKIPTPERRVMMAKALSMQPVVLVRLCVRPDTDIDEVAAYWGNMKNVNFTELRPMLEALKGLPTGGSLSLMYFLPPFARTRLYTYPPPKKPGDPTMDCHWTTFNFSNIEPDNRFNFPEYTLDYIQKNYFRVDSPSVYGDIVLYINDKQEIKHSAVFLADDLAFTKYGDNNLQPWMIVRLADMQAVYPSLKPYYFRRRTD